MHPRVDESRALHPPRVPLLAPHREEQAPHEGGQAAKISPPPHPSSENRVRKLLRHDLLRVARLQPRAGRLVKHYQVRAESFIVPYVASRAASSAEFVEQLEGTLLEAFYESSLPEGESDRFGLQVGPGTDGEHPSMTIVIRQDGGWQLGRDLDVDPVNTLLLSILRLPTAEAEALRHELEALLDRYTEREVPGALAFLLRLGLVRLRR